ncbi:MAG: DUF1318 domain-containing protein [Zoogloeaceae bacterium]|nr:DUF1318 domain-containing protein [Zoogloeaceae bacterium]
MKKLMMLLATLALTTAAQAAPPPEKINLDIGTPPVIVLKHAMAQRYSRLVRFYESGVIGLDDKGMVKMHDRSKLTDNYTLQKIAEKLIDQENPDRMSLIYAIAEAHGGKEAIPAVTEAQVKRWKEQFHKGWWMEDDKGNWHQKP